MNYFVRMYSENHALFCQEEATDTVKVASFTKKKISSFQESLAIISVGVAFSG